MKIPYHFNALPLLVLLGTAMAADAQVQPQLAQQYFEEARKLCERDAGRLWGVSLCGPMVIFDQATKTRATSQPEPEGPPPRFSVFADGPVNWGWLRWFSYPCICSRTRMPLRVSKICYTGCSIVFSPSWG